MTDCAGNGTSGDVGKIATDPTYQRSRRPTDHPRNDSPRHLAAIPAIYPPPIGSRFPRPILGVLDVADDEE
jgi:hypothetical protein